MRQRIIADTIFVFLSIVVAIFIVKIGIVHKLTASFSDFEYLGSFLAGFFFTSVFTTAPAIVILGELAQENSIILVAILGGLGAMIGDYILFRFIRDRVREDLNYLFKLSSTKEKASALICNSTFCRWGMPLLGSVVIISPFPDEIGLALMGMTEMKEKLFLPLTFILNAIGIYLIGAIANITMW